jgi:GNAT superfamily N-acetyltransferase
MGAASLKDVRLDDATAGDAAKVAELREAVASRLTREFGSGPWSVLASERGVINDLRTSRVLVLRDRDRIIASLRLSTRKPWSIDPSYFSSSLRPLYLSDMAVHPDHQRKGIGRHCLQEARRVAQAWPSDAIRLDAYDAPAGAGRFYLRCGYRQVGQAAYRSTQLLYYELLL